MKTLSFANIMIVLTLKYAMLTALWIGLSAAQEKPIPAKGDNGDTGGIFGLGLSIMSAGIDPKITLGLMTPGSETPKAGSAGSTTVGSGPYEAHYIEDPTLPNHTIYAPKTPPAGIKLPVVVFGNGGCMNVGTAMRSLLLEIASHGYLAIANGPATKGFSFNIPEGGLPKFSGSGLSGLLSGMGAIGQSKVKQMTDSIDWIMNDGAKKYGNIDKDKIVAAGQSCGGLEAYSTSYHDDRVKLTMIFNVGVFDESRRYLMSELKAPIGWFMGGPNDGGYLLALKDYDLLPKGVPAMFASLDTGHMGTYAAPNAGKFGKAAVAFLEWQFRGKEDAKKKFMDPAAEGSLVSAHWNVTTKNF